ncbi:protein of unknown function (plasmid) [Caballeronia sp. S22]
MTLLCACAAPAAPRSASERDVSAIRFIEFSTRMIKIVVAGAENNATFRNLRNEKILTVSKNTHSGLTPACKGFSGSLKTNFGRQACLGKVPRAIGHSNRDF